VQTNLVVSAARANAKIVTDNAANRNRQFNVGEREVVKLLLELGYIPSNEDDIRAIWTKH